MNPLAFNFDGEAFELPPTAAGWRVKRLRAGKGAPELVYNSDGLPLVVPLETDMDELRRIVGVAGKYRLDPVDEEQRVVKGADTAYVLVRSGEPMSVTAEPTTAAESGPNTNAVLMEAMRQNSELARSVVERFPAMLDASANLLRAADGAGMPARKPRHDYADSRDGATDDDEDDGEPVPSKGFDLTALLLGLAPLVMEALGKSGIEWPSLLEMLDWRRAGRKSSKDGAASKPPGASAGKATPSGMGKQSPSTGSATDKEAPSAEQSGADTATSDDTDTSLPPLSPKAMVHFVAIMAALTPEEAALARAAAEELSPRDKRAWFEQLMSMGVPEAAARIREILASTKTKEAA